MGVLPAPFTQPSCHTKDNYDYYDCRVNCSREAMMRLCGCLPFNIMYDEGKNNLSEF